MASGRFSIGKTIGIAALVILAGLGTYAAWYSYQRQEKIAQAAECAYQIDHPAPPKMVRAPDGSLARLESINVCLAIVVPPSLFDLVRGRIAFTGIPERMKVNRYSLMDVLSGNYTLGPDFGMPCDPSATTTGCGVSLPPPSRPTPEGGGGVVCTMEALQCPDGSYVGRQGPQCAFAACPDQASHTGVLRQSPAGFDLLVAAPDGGGQEVSYAMPLTITVSDVLSRIVGKKVQVFGSFSAGNTLLVDHLEELAESDPTLGETGVGQAAFVNGVKITVNGVVEDSRCPESVQCIWAGRVTANVTLQSDTDKETIDLASDKTLPFDSYQVSLEKVMPPRGTQKPEPREYVLTFKVVAN